MHSSINSSAPFRPVRWIVAALVLGVVCYLAGVVNTANAQAQPAPTTCASNAGR